MSEDVEIAEMLKALAHPVRLEILRYLLRGPSCATLANREVNISQPNLSQHLKILTGAGVIDYRKVGTKKCFYVCLPELVEHLFDIFGADRHKICLKDKDLKMNGVADGS